MASVTPVKRRTGYAWRVQARDDTGRMIQETFFDPDPARAESAARSFAKVADRLGITEARRIRTARDTALADGSDVVTLRDWMERYLDADSGILAGVAPGARARYQQIARDAILPWLGEMPLEALTRDDINVWMAKIQREPKADGSTRAQKTIRNYHGLLSQALAEAHSRGLAPGNPARGLKASRTAKRTMVVLSQSEFNVLMRFVPADWRPLFIFMAGTGLRWSEVTALTWGDIDADSNPPMVHVTKAWIDVRGGGKRRIGPPKSEAGERTISVPPELLRELGPRGRGDALVFATSTGTAHWSGSVWTRVWGPAVEAANDEAKCKAAGLTPLGKRPRIHDIRHCHASWLIAAGRPLPYIQARLGHEKITTTVGTYGHLMPDAGAGDADAVGLVMSTILTAVEPEPAQIEA